MKHEKLTPHPCPACNTPLILEPDGSIGKHWVGEHAWDMKPCDGVAKAKQEKREGKKAA
jgi:hypothetical protein